MKHVGKHADRLKPSANNPREIAFAEQWAEENEERQIGPASIGCTLDALLGGRASQLDATNVATVIQWLGSNVGWSFLNEAIERCGFKIVEKKNHRESGQAAIESALILPIFFFVVIGIFDFGQFLYFNQTLTMRLEAGARYAAVHGCKSPIATVCDPAVNVAVTNTADGSGAPMLAHLSASDISASVSFHRSQDPTPTVPRPAWIANEEDRVTLSVSDYPIDLLFFPKFHRKASASQPIEWYQCYRDCK